MFSMFVVETNIGYYTSLMFTWTSGIVALDVLVVEDSRVSLGGDKDTSNDPLQN